MRAALIALLAGALHPAAPALAAEARVGVDSGVIVGDGDGQVSAFKGIPYAAAPVGDLRWKPPAAPVWLVYRAADDRVMQLSAQPAVIPNPSAKAIDLIVARAEDQRP